MVDAINAIGHVMGIQTIAEWVEDDVTLAMLERIGVDYVQGYAIDSPRPLCEIDLLRGPAGRGSDPSLELVHA